MRSGRAVPGAMAASRRLARPHSPTTTFVSVLLSALIGAETQGDPTFPTPHGDLQAVFW